MPFWNRKENSNSDDHYTLVEAGLEYIDPNEQSPESRTVFVIRPTTPDLSELGMLKSLFFIERSWNPVSGLYEETKRYVRIGDAMVYEGFRRKGISKQMLDLLEQRAKEFGASYVEARVTFSDRSSQPWLVDMYTARGYSVTEKEGDWDIIKELNK